jgi:hypothetical protein
MAKSRYVPTRLLQRSDKPEPRHYATWDLPEGLHGLREINLLEGLVTHEHVWSIGDRMDKLSNKYYGDDQYAWLIALVNNIGYQLGVAPGTSLQIPADVMPVLEKLDMV